MLQVFVFNIPVESGERIGFSTTLLLAITVYMTIVSNRLPDFSYLDISYLSNFLLSDVTSGILLIICVIQSLRFYHAPVMQQFPKVWVPDLIVGNPYGSNINLAENGRVVQFTNEGEAVWQPANVFEMNCVAQIAYYPFDMQNCTFGFLPWGFGVKDLFFNVVSQELMNIYFSPNGKWEITNTRLYSQIFYGDQLLRLEFTFKRRSRYEIINTVGPIIILGMLQVFVFIIPVESGERIGFSTTLLLAITVYMTIVSDRLPDVSYPDISYLSYFLLSDVTSGVLLIVCVIQSLRFYHAPDSQQFPKWVIYITKVCSKWKQKVSPKDKQHINDEQIVNSDDIHVPTASEEEEREAPPINWPMISGCFDKICICCFTCICMIRTIVLFVMLTM
ncbi:acetylcholine receptor subunit beta-like [Argopecten irradians]|uniref:acetylcholine receptor subunit beta-like n=1 Tax=Argopecten irradians TaxID=31199 RepID=UPI003712BAC8